MFKNILSTVMTLTVLSLMACGGHHDHDKEKENKESKESSHADEIVLTHEQQEQGGIVTETVQPAPFASTLKVGGLLLPNQDDETTVVATANGVVSIAQQGISEGMKISARQPLVHLSASQLQDGNPVAKAKADYEAAKSDYERAVALAKEQIVSQRELSQLKRAYDTARETYGALAQSTDSRGTAVSSRISGYVKQLLVKQGDYVTVGQPIAVVTKCRRLLLRADVPVGKAQLLSKVATAHFRPTGSTEVFQLKDLHGRLLSFARSAKEGSAYLPITFELDNIGELTAGVYADVWLLTKEERDVLTIPNTALCEAQGTYHVYVQTGKEVFEQREVSIGATDGKRTIVSKGLKKGDKVVSKGAIQVRIAALQSALPEHSHQH